MLFKNKYFIVTFFALILTGCANLPPGPPGSTIVNRFLAEPELCPSINAKMQNLHDIVLNMVPAKNRKGHYVQPDIEAYTYYVVDYDFSNLNQEQKMIVLKAQSQADGLNYQSDINFCKNTAKEVVLKGQGC